MQNMCQHGKSGDSSVLPGRLWAPLFIMAGISILSGTAGPQLGPVSFVGIDKAGHLVVFGLLGTAWVRIFQGNPSSERPLRLLLAVSLSTLFGLFDELHQLGNPLRSFEWADLLADFLGALGGAACYLHSARWRLFLEHELCRWTRLRSPRNPANSPR